MEPLVSKHIVDKLSDEQKNHLIDKFWQEFLKENPNVSKTFIELNGEIPSAENSSKELISNGLYEESRKWKDFRRKKLKDYINSDQINELDEIYLLGVNLIYNILDECFTILYKDDLKNIKDYIINETKTFYDSLLLNEEEQDEQQKGRWDAVLDKLLNTGNSFKNFYKKLADPNRRANRKLIESLLNNSVAVKNYIENDPKNAEKVRRLISTSKTPIRTALMIGSKLRKHQLKDQERSDNKMLSFIAEVENIRDSNDLDNQAKKDYKQLINLYKKIYTKIKNAATPDPKDIENEAFIRKLLTNMIANYKRPWENIHFNTVVPYGHLFIAAKRYNKLIMSIPFEDENMLSRALTSIETYQQFILGLINKLNISSSNRIPKTLKFPFNQNFIFKLQKTNQTLITLIRYIKHKYNTKFRIKKDGTYIPNTNINPSVYLLKLKEHYKENPIIIKKATQLLNDKGIIINESLEYYNEDLIALSENKYQLYNLYNLYNLLTKKYCSLKLYRNAHVGINLRSVIDHSKSYVDANNDPSLYDPTLVRMPSYYTKYAINKALNGDLTPHQNIRYEWDEAIDQFKTKVLQNNNHREILIDIIKKPESEHNFFERIIYKYYNFYKKQSLELTKRSIDINNSIIAKEESARLAAEQEENIIIRMWNDMKVKVEPLRQVFNDNPTLKTVIMICASTTALALTFCLFMIWYNRYRKRNIISS